MNDPLFTVDWEADEHISYLDEVREHMLEFTRERELEQLPPAAGQ
ncbi:MAG: hypothetical protein PF961_05080 [Planctomycetota bacterium]|nr:hypothetical protein [Planctomycetota bacterium]